MRLPVHQSFPFAICCVAICAASTGFGQTDSPIQYPPVVEQAYFSVGDAPAAPAPTTGPTATQPFSPRPAFFRNSPAVAAATKPLTSKFNRSVVDIRDADSNRIALATVVSNNNHIVTKYSLVKDLNATSLQFTCGTQKWKGRLIGHDQTSDLALFELGGFPENVEKEPLQGVTFADASPVGFGKLVVSPDQAASAPAIGMTTRRPIEPLTPECVDCIDFGLTVTETLQVTRIYPGTAGHRLGISIGDVIESVNGKPLFAASQFREIEKVAKSGDLISISVLRNGARELISGKVPDQTVADKRDRWGGGPFSKRRFGFADAVFHDSVIAPENCGGPLIDLDGKFRGINIARAYRVASVTLTSENVRQFLMRYLSVEDLNIQR